MPTKSKPNKIFRGRIVQWAFLDLFLLFAAISYFKPAVGLAGLGSVLILGALTVLANKESIWDNYKKGYKKPKNDYLDELQKPKELYYQLNIYLLMPAAMILGILAIWTAWTLA